MADPGHSFSAEIFSAFVVAVVVCCCIAILNASQGSFCIIRCCYFCCCSPLVYLPQLFCRSVRVLCCFVRFRVVGRPKTDYTNMTARTENLTHFNRYDIINKLF